jgi:hypothetical protein
VLLHSPGDGESAARARPRRYAVRASVRPGRAIQVSAFGACTSPFRISGEEPFDPLRPLRYTGLLHETLPHRSPKKLSYDGFVPPISENDPLETMTNGSFAASDPRFTAASYQVS